MTRPLAMIAARAAATRGAEEFAADLAMTVAVWSAVTVSVRLSVIRVITPRLFTAPCDVDVGAAFVVPVIRNMEDPSSWFAVMIERVDVDCAEVSVFDADEPVAEEPGTDDVAADDEGRTTRVVSPATEVLDEVAAVAERAVFVAVPLMPELRIEVTKPDDVASAGALVLSERRPERVVLAEAEGSLPESVEEVMIGSLPESVDESRGSLPESTADEVGSLPESVAEGMGSLPESVEEVVGSTPDSTFEGALDADAVCEAVALVSDVWPGRM